MDFNIKNCICGKFSQYLPEWVCRPSEKQGCFGKIKITHIPEDLVKQSGLEDALEERCQSKKPAVVAWTPNTSTSNIPNLE